MNLREKTVHDLRSIAHSYGIADVFKKTKNALIQMIELKAAKILEDKVEIPPRNEHDPRVKSWYPAQDQVHEQITELLADHMQKGLHLSFPSPLHWQISFRGKEDSGNTSIPLRVILGCAERLMK